MTNNTPRYDIAKIRELLLAAFTAESLRQLFLYTKRPHLRALLQQFGPDDSLATMVDEVITHCEKKDLYCGLLDEVERANPRQYNQHGPYLLPPGPPPVPPDRVASPEGQPDIATKRLRITKLGLPGCSLRHVIILLSLVIALALVGIGILVIRSRRGAVNATRTAVTLITPTPSRTRTVMPIHTATLQPTPPGTPTVMPIHTATLQPTPTAIVTATLPPCMGRSPGSPESFSVYPDYDPSGYMGDIGDIVNVEKGPEGVRFTIEVGGQGPHEWEWKYVQGELNPDPAKFAGVMYLCCGWGEKPGFDLRAFHRKIAWEARSLSGEVNVEFVIGGVDWIWDDGKRVKISPHCPDSLRQKRLGTYLLTGEWKSFEADLADIPEEEFVNVIGGFAWIITWGSNGIELNKTPTPPAPEEPETFIIEIRNVRYER